MLKTAEVKIHIWKMWNNKDKLYFLFILLPDDFYSWNLVEILFGLKYDFAFQVDLSAVIEHCCY